jgi:uncharacterized OB-fold protein
MTKTTIKSLPRMTADAAQYWEGMRHNELRYQTCTKCGSIVFHPRYVCPYCLSAELKWQKSSGKGKIYSFSTLYRAAYEALKSRIPYTLAIIEVDEGFFMFSEVVDCDPSRIAIGTPVKVVFHKIDEEVTLPKFRPI